MNKLNLTAKEKYEYVIKARNFHYREFNVWSTYFSIIVGALFVAYYNLLKDHPLLAFVVSALGFIASLCWYLSAKGYTYWWTHWSKYLIYLENQDINTIRSCGVYSTFFDKNSKCRKGDTKAEFASSSLWNPLEGSNVSTSKVMMFLTFCITVVWALVCLGSMINVIVEMFYNKNDAVDWLRSNVGLFVTCIIGSLIVIFCTTCLIVEFFGVVESDMSNHKKPVFKD